MTPEKLAEALSDCEKRIRERFQVAPARLSPYDRSRSDLVRDGGRGGAAEHVLWMAIEAQSYVKQGRHGKAFRWLGFVQCFLWMTNTSSIEGLKATNRPDDRAAPTG